MSENIYTEQELVCLIKQKDKSAFEYVYDKYAAPFYGIILKNLSNDEKSAQEILQEVFLKIWKSVELYDNTKEALFAWMFKIVSSTIKDKIGVLKKFSIQMTKSNVISLEN